MLVLSGELPTVSELFSEFFRLYSVFDFMTLLRQDGVALSIQLLLTHSCIFTIVLRALTSKKNVKCAMPQKLSQPKILSKLRKKIKDLEQGILSLKLLLNKNK